MRSRIRLIPSAVAILVMIAVSVSGLAVAGDSLPFSSARVPVSFVADRDAAGRPRSDEADRRTKDLQQGLQQLGLSKKQMDEIGRITSEFRKNVAPFGPTAQALATERNRLVNQGAEKDRQRIAEIDLEIGKIRKQVIDARSRLQARLLEILTPEQRVKFERMIRQGDGNRQPGGPAGN